MANDKPSLMDYNDDDESTGTGDMYAVYDEFRKRFINGTPEESMDALLGMCHLAEKAHGEEGEYGEKPKIAIEVC